MISLLFFDVSIGLKSFICQEFRKEILSNKEDSRYQQLQSVLTNGEENVTKCCHITELPFFENSHLAWFGGSIFAALTASNSKCYNLQEGASTNNSNRLSAPDWISDHQNRNPLPMSSLFPSGH
jgi:hypothetical protein